MNQFSRYVDWRYFIRPIGRGYWRHRIAFLLLLFAFWDGPGWLSYPPIFDTQDQLWLKRTNHMEERAAAFATSAILILSAICSRLGNPFIDPDTTWRPEPQPTKVGKIIRSPSANARESSTSY